MSQVLEAPVVAHVLVAAVQRRHGHGHGEGIGPPGTAAADVGRVGDGIQAAVRQGRVGVERVQDLGEAGVQLRFTHVSSGYAVRRVAVAPDLSWEHREVTKCQRRQIKATKNKASTNGPAADVLIKTTSGPTSYRRQYSGFVPFSGGSVISSETPQDRSHQTRLLADALENRNCAAYN